MQARASSVLPLNRLVLACMASPVAVVFVSSNVVNVGNLGFNMLFSRLMGPELFGDLAVLLTLKLAVLGILGAIQMAASQRIAAGRDGADETELTAIATASFLALWFLLPVIGAIVWISGLEGALGLRSNGLILILVLSLPFTMPLAIGRGIVLGRMSTGRIVASANLEMLTRLIGGWAVWKAGFGLEGVTFVLALSIVMGLVALGPAGRVGTLFPKVSRPVLKGLLIASLPFAALQAGQVILLDGDVFIAKRYLSPSDGGYIAVLALFQRIQFFGCFALASVLLPSVTRARADGRHDANALVWVIALFACVSVLLFGASLLMPETLVTLLAGPDFAPASASLHVAVIAAIGFTLSYLLATYLAALDDHMGIWLTILLAPFQIGAMAYYASQHSGDLHQLLAIKASALVALSVVLFAYCVVRDLRVEATAEFPQPPHEVHKE